MVWQLEKMLDENKEKIPEDEQQEATTLVDDVKKTLEKEDATFDEVSESTSKVIETLQKLAPHIQPPPEEASCGVPPQEEPANNPAKEDVVEADFEVVDDEVENKE